MTQTIIEQVTLCTSDWFYCPNGHQQHYSKSEAQKLREQLETRDRELRKSKCETLNERNAKLAVEAEKAKVERKLARVKRGVCPCCNRSFNNLQRHMATKHADQKTS